jgi:hypothetical protein
MTRFLSFIAIFAAVVVSTISSSDAAPKGAKDRILTCSGPFARDATHASVVKAFGSRHVSYQAIQVPDDEGVKATVIFPGNPARRTEIIWRDTKLRRGPNTVTAGPAWRTADGVTVGASLAEIEKLNGRPFTLSGFDWDYGGTVTDWEGGQLAKQKGGCRLIVRFGIGDDAPSAAANAVSGDKDFSSRNANMVAVKPVVREIAIMYE